LSGDTRSTWWDPSASIAATLVTGDVWAMSELDVLALPLVEQLSGRIRVVGDASTPLAAGVTANGITAWVPEPPGYEPVHDLDEVRRKWDAMDPAGDADQVAQGVLNGTSGAVDRLLT
jgi:hypothetical protein